MEKHVEQLPKILIIKAPEEYSPFSSPSALSLENKMLAMDFQLLVLSIYETSEQKENYRTHTHTGNNLITIDIFIKKTSFALLHNKRIVTALLAGAKVAKNTMGRANLIHLHHYHKTLIGMVRRIFKKTPKLLLCHPDELQDSVPEGIHHHMLSCNPADISLSGSLPTPVNDEMFQTEDSTTGQLLLLAFPDVDIKDKALDDLWNTLQESGLTLYLWTSKNKQQALSQHLPCKLVDNKELALHIRQAEKLICLENAPRPNDLYLNICSAHKPLLVIGPHPKQHHGLDRFWTSMPTAQANKQSLKAFLQNNEAFPLEAYEELVRENYAADVYAFNIKNLYFRYLKQQNG